MTLHHRLVKLTYAATYHFVKPPYDTTSLYDQRSVCSHITVWKYHQMALHHRLVNLPSAATSLTMWTNLHIATGLVNPPYGTTSPFGKTSIWQYIAVWSK